MNTPHRPHHSPEHHVADRLADRAGHVELGPPMLDVVVARGRQRQHRRRTAIGVAAVVGIGAGSIATISALSRPAGPDRIAAAPTADATTGTLADTPPATVAMPIAAPPAPLDLVASPFAWNRVDPDSTEAVSFSLGAPDNMLAGNGPFVVWSTAPAVSDDYTGVLWRSDDGQSWEQVASPPALTGRNITELNGRFLTYGTAPATAQGRRSDLAIGTSDDAGRTWATAVLPLDTSELLAEPGVESVGVNATSIAATSTGVLVSAQVNALVDLQTKLPADVRDGVWTLTDAGVEVPSGGDCEAATASTISFGGPVGTETPVDTAVATASTISFGGPPTTVSSAGSCTVRTISWAELGISERAARTMMHPEVRMMFSADGETFTEITPVGITAGATDIRLTALGESFVASVNVLDPGGWNATALYSSPDGRSWTALAAPPVMWAEGFAAFGDRLVLSGYDMTADRQVVAVLDASGTWTTTPLASFVQPGDGVQATMGGSSLAVGPNGISMAGALFVDPIAEIGGVTFSQDGITVEIDDTSYTHRVIDDATGEVLATMTMETSSNSDLVNMVYNDTGITTVTVRREPGGDVVTTYTYEDLANAVAVATGAQPTGPKMFLLHSRDGITWSRESLDDIAGETVSGTGGIRITDSQVIVAANLAGERNPDGTVRQTLLIATPTT